MIRSLLTLVTALAVTPVLAPAAQASTEFQQVAIDLSSLQVPAEAEVTLTWQPQISPTYVECKTADRAESAGLLTSVTASCWATESQTITVTASYAGQQASAPLAFTSPKPAGSPRDYRLMRTPGGQFLKFESCATIPVRINLGGAPRNPDLEFAARFAVRQLAQASGLRLVFKGRSSYMPRRGAEPPRRGIWIGYAYPGAGKGRSNLLTRGNRDELGIGGPYYSGRTIVSGQLVLSRKNLAKFGGTPLLIETLMHELAHTVGVDHSSARGGQIMAPVATGEANVTWGRGDLRALQKVGPGRSCPAQL